MTAQFASDQQFTRNGRSAWLLDRTRGAQRWHGWMTVRDTSTGFDAGTRQHATREAAVTCIEDYLA